ncbi:MAG: sigma-70 family RNA polymerase sigma factor [Candidatus Cellulosilyticum pullistercoris]|uniref:RNA polymerase sigma factor n=1 Tax=Candidatus Cellulosilyticum pullistercoris TaxID=2838521 RepID=A0A9E2NL65_9FIRM|nr:sigma-70 family RNA polymerase sigma factor [Candidatus Cellulosilyticum pullistercoris]
MTNEELVELYQSGDAGSLEELIKKNDGLVHTIARKFNTENIASIEYDDLLQEGRIGLMVAASKYNLNIDNRAAFSTYAIHWIRQKISRFIKYRNTNNETSLNKPVCGEGDEIELADTIVSEEDEFCKIEDSVYYQQLREELTEVMQKQLSLRQRQVIQLRYGFDGKEYTLKETGEIFNVSSARAGQIERESLRKMRNSTWGRMKMSERKEERLQKSNPYIEEYIQYNLGNTLPVNEILKRVTSN